jgi:hypothetical protein
MIPGNRPEDEAEDAFWAAFGDKLDADGVRSICIPVGTIPPHMRIEDLWDDDDFVKVVQIARDLGYARGFDDGKMEAVIDEAAEQSEVIEGTAVEQTVTIQDEYGNEVVVGSRCVYGAPDDESDPNYVVTVAAISDVDGDYDDELGRGVMIPPFVTVKFENGEDEDVIRTVADGNQSSYWDDLTFIVGDLKVIS